MSTVTDKHALLSLALGKQTEKIRHLYTEEDINGFNAEIIKNLMKINDLKASLQQEKDKYKKIMDPLERMNSTYLQNVRDGYRDEDIEVYLVPDYDNKIIEFFNEGGEKIGERKMFVSELQGRLQLP